MSAETTHPPPDEARILSDVFITKEWLRIVEAVSLIRAGKAHRIDGDGFKAYRVKDGTVRIDLPPIEHIPLPEKEEPDA